MGDIIDSRADFKELLGLPPSTLIVLDAGGPTAMFDQLGLDIWALALIKAAEPPPETPKEEPAVAAT
jgi:hypothetical protein